MAEAHPMMFTPEGVQRRQLVDIYVDEIRPSRNELNELWMYVGAVMLRVEDRSAILRELEEARRRHACSSELHFSKLTNWHNKDVCAEDWLDVILFDRRIHFHILGVQVDKMRWSDFGSTRSEQHLNMYTRFVRPAIVYGAKQSFGHDVRIARIVHDKATDLENHDLFSWHAVWRIERDHEISVDEGAIVFVDSDHRTELQNLEDSHFLQLADLTVGSVRQVLDATSTKAVQVRLAEKMYPLVRRIMDPRQRRNPNSRYAHAGRCSLSFFPGAASRFYWYREPLLHPGGRQPRLFDP